MMYTDYGIYSPDITFFSDKVIGTGKWIYSSGKRRTHFGTLFFMTTFAPWAFTSSKIFPASSRLNREIDIVFSIVLLIEFIVITS